MIEFENNLENVPTSFQVSKSTKTTSLLACKALKLDQTNRAGTKSNYVLHKGIKLMPLISLLTVQAASQRAFSTIPLRLKDCRRLCLNVPPRQAGF